MEATRSSETSVLTNNTRRKIPEDGLLSQGRLKIADDGRRGAEVAETTVKHFYASGFGALVKRLDKCIDVGGGHVEE
jgi:hypothetical protein